MFTSLWNCFSLWIYVIVLCDTLIFSCDILIVSCDTVIVSCDTLNFLQCFLSFPNKVLLNERKVFWIRNSFGLRVLMITINISYTNLVCFQNVLFTKVLQLLSLKYTCNFFNFDVF